jgi:LPXTG-motif cell wall-anchored protein
MTDKTAAPTSDQTGAAQSSTPADQTGAAPSSTPADQTGAAQSSTPADQTGATPSNTPADQTGATSTTGTSDQSGAAADQNAAGAMDQGATKHGKLPQTGSPLPLIGLIGLGSLAAGAASRKRK